MKVVLEPPIGARERALSVLGIVPASRARRSGYTHHALFYGLIPSWFAFEGLHGCTTCPKWRPLDWLEPLLAPLWCLAWECTHDEHEPPLWGIKIGRRIA